MRHIQLTNIIVTFRAFTIRTTYVHNIRTVRIAIRISLTNNIPNVRVLNVPDVRIVRSHNHVHYTVHSTKFRVPHSNVAIGLTPNSVHGANDNFSLPVTVTILTTSKRVPHSGLSHYLVTNRLNLSNAILPIGNRITFRLLTHSVKLSFVTNESSRRIPLTNISYKFVSRLSRLTRNVNSTTQRCLSSRNIRTAFRPRLSCTSMLKRRITGHNVTLTTTNRLNLLVVKSPKSNGAVLTHHVANVLPRLSIRSRRRTLYVRSILNRGVSNLLTKRQPFHDPRRDVSATNLVNNKHPIRPNRVDLTRNNILFLSRLTRFPANILRSLHRPVRHNCIEVMHISKTFAFPSHFRLLTTDGPYPYNFLNSHRIPYHYSTSVIRHCQTGLHNPLTSHVSVVVSMAHPSPRIVVRNTRNVSSTRLHSCIIHNHTFHT